MRILQEEYAKDKHYALLKDDLHQTARALQLIIIWKMLSIRI